MKNRSAKINALNEQIKIGKIESDKAKILAFIKGRNDANLINRPTLLNIKINVASARISDLLDLGVIYVAGTFNNDKNSFFRYEPDEDKQRYNALKRQEHNFALWIKKGKKYYMHFMTENLQNEINLIDL